MKNKGFVLMETIVVIVVISVALVTVFASYNKILSKLKTENKYDTSEYIYMTNYIKENLEDTISPDDIYPHCAPNCSCRPGRGLPAHRAGPVRDSPVRRR